ncbi:MAG: M20/M25/M40 family metallo-hydrolase [Acidobacteriales bacterium]|nr:M20/M25/M40 family metallo-hydrolase [Terriglobales bacterium]
MKIRSLILTFLLLSQFADSQLRKQREFSPAEQVLMRQMAQIQKAALESDAAYRWLAHFCNNIGPRLTGSPQADFAVLYGQAELRKLGLKIVTHKMLVPHWVRGAETARLVEWPGMTPGTSQKLLVTALGGSVATPQEGITADVVVVDSIADMKALGAEKVRGKIVIFNNFFDKAMARSGHAFEAYGKAVQVRGRGASEAARLGAVATLIRSVGSAEFRVPHTGGLIYAKDVPQIPAGALTHEDVSTIVDLAQQGRVRLHLTLTPQTLPDVESSNLIADIPGTEHPEEIVIISGHIDSWDLGTGALDDGAGVVAAMQIAETLKWLGLKPKRTIRIVGWMNEENGGRGAKAYATDFASLMGDHIAAIEMDSGAGHALGFQLRVAEKSMDLFAPVTTVLDAQGAGLLQRTDGSPGADIGDLDELGVPTIGMWNDGRDYFHYHHTPADTFDKVDKRNLQENAAAMAALAWYLANMEGRPQQK